MNASNLLNQLAMQGPVLLVLVVGLILALTKWSTQPKASLLAVIGIGILVVAALTFPFAQNYVLQQRYRGTSSSTSISTSLTMLGWIWSIVRAVGTGLIVSAIFAGRSVSAGSGFQVMPPPPMMPPGYPPRQPTTYR